MIKLTPEQSRKIYINAGGPADHDDADWKDIHVEMEGILNAKSLGEAKRIIDWWGCWDSKYTSTAFVKRVKEAYEHVDNLWG